METKLKTPPNTALSLQTPASLPSLQHEAGLTGRWRAGRAAGREAARALADTRIAKLQADERIAKTNIAIAEGAVKGALVAEGMGAIGALVTDLALKTGAVQSQLTAVAGAERITHVETRANSFAALNARLAQGRISQEEAEALKAQATGDLVGEVERTNARINRSKDAVEAIHDLALNSLRRAADIIR